MPLTYSTQTAAAAIPTALTNSGLVSFAAGKKRTGGGGRETEKSNRKLRKLRAIGGRIFLSPLAVRTRKTRKEPRLFSVRYRLLQ